MFKKIQNKRGIESDEGFAVERTGSPLTEFLIIYSEGKKNIVYHLENLKPGCVDKIYPDQIKNWEPPFEKEEIDQKRKLNIAYRIRDAMAFLGDKIEVVDRFSAY